MKCIKLWIFLSIFNGLYVVGCGHLHMNWTESPVAEPSSYRDYRSSFLWGFSRSRPLDFSKLCQSQTPLKIMTYSNLEDVLFATLTLGFYRSQTIEVWCPTPKPQVETTSFSNLRNTPKMNHGRSHSEVYF